ncbi:MAG: glycosyltransferase family 2 protein [Planctomycetia bacterium]
MLVSLVIPVLNESDNLDALWAGLKETTARMPEITFEAVFVDDGSSDDTAARIRGLAASENISWLLVQLSRNFGHQAAITAGMQFATGDAIVFLDADLQDPPELVPVFVEKFREGYDVVYGVRQNRKEPAWLRFCFKTFYRLFNWIAERPIPLDAGDFGLMSRRVAKLISEMPEKDRLIRAMRSWVGFRQIGVPYDRPGRYAGTSRYSLMRRIDGALDGLFGYSKLPIRLSLCLGTAVFLIGATYLLYALLATLILRGTPAPGWTSEIVVAFMLGGANLIATSIVGEYVCRIYFQSKNRPLYVVAETARSGEAG